MRLRALRRSDTGQAAGLGAAVALGNVVSLVFSVVFVRLLGASGFGSLASLLSAFFILSIPGTALQTTVAREVSSAAAAGDALRLTGSVRHWLRTATAWAIGLTVLSVLARDQIADLLGVDDTWAAAATVPIAALWMLVSIERGALQGLQEYAVVGQSILWESVGRLAIGLALVGLGAGVTGAFVGHGIALLIIALVLDRMLARRHVAASGGRPHEERELTRTIVRLAWLPALSLVLLAILQNIDVIVVKHQVPPKAAGAYAAASLAAKAIVWIAIGLGLYLLPETSRRAAAGEPTRRLLLTTLGLAVAAAVPICLVYAVGGRQILEIAFGHAYVSARAVLPLLGIAMTLLAVTYLAVQYLLGLRRTGFLWVLGAAALAEAPLLVLAGERLTDIALMLAALQLALAGALFAATILRGRAERS